MKISKLHIEQYKHLENLEFDFTYQTGKRKGQPLDKICFIGQSATGKTNQYWSCYFFRSNRVTSLVNCRRNSWLLTCSLHLAILKQKEMVKFHYTTFKANTYIKNNNGLTTYNEKVYSSGEIMEGVVHFNDFLINVNPSFHFFKANIISR